MSILRPSRYSLSEAKITPEATLWGRREFLRGLALAATGAALSGCNSKEDAGPTGTDLPPRPSDTFYPPARTSKYQVGDRTLTPANVAGRYNNFYEFTTDKADVARLAAKLTIDPWTIELAGLVQNPSQIGFEDLVKTFPLEERIYRMRSVVNGSALGRLSFSKICRFLPAPFVGEIRTISFVSSPARSNRATTGCISMALL